MEKTPDSLPKSRKPAGQAGKKSRAPRLSREARREQLLKVAIKIFSSNGIGHANHSQIAAEAGVSLALVFDYFPTHDDLTGAVIQEVSRFIYTELIAEKQKEGRSIRASIEDMVIAFAESIRHPIYGDYGKIWFDWSSATSANTWPEYLKYNEKTRVFLEGVIARGKEIGEIPEYMNEREAAWVLKGIGYMAMHMVVTGESILCVARTVDISLSAIFKNSASGPA